MTKISSNLVLLPNPLVDDTELYVLFLLEGERRTVTYSNSTVLFYLAKGMIDLRR